MIEEHADEGITNIAGRCLECHANGEENDDRRPPRLGQAASNRIAVLINFVRRGG
jgi:hypothetical protein